MPRSSTSRSNRSTPRYRLRRIFPDISFAVRDVAVHGGPWRTLFAVRLDVTATLADGTRDHNEACQWITLRWVG
jgi:hypothetical protein